MNPLEQQLKRLCEVDSEHFQATECADEIAWDERYRVGYALWLGEDGQLQGGEALWWMLSEMQSRKKAIAHRGTDEFGILVWDALTNIEQNEFRAVELFLRSKTEMLTPELILSTYIQWKEATK